MGFPPGEIAGKFDAARDLAAGDFVYVRMRVWRLNRDGRFAACRVYDQNGIGFHQLPVPFARIVGREPPAIEFNQGIIRAAPGL